MPVKMLFAPFRSGAAHIVAFRPIFPDVPERVQKGRQHAHGMAEMGYQNGCEKR